MIHLDEERNVFERSGSRTMLVMIAQHGRGTAGRARRAESENRNRFAASLRDGHDPPCPYRTPVWIAVPVAAFSLAALAIWLLTARPGDWLLTIAGAPAFAINPDVGGAIAGADWLALAIQSGSLQEVIGAAIAIVTVMALIALRVRQRIDTATRRAVEDPVGVYKIVTNQTKRDDRRTVAWHRLSPSPACERVKTMMCG